ncbi:MAG: recombinase family protein [Clostridiales bacterium]|jgi:DNA invertase Pin-like site-specific DNA recombinase|nr:recombinase family protein [Clostridiales bacterium]
MNQHCIYLRKSRADAEAEAYGEGETLTRHEKALMELAKRQQLSVTKIYKEIVSGDTIAARPVMRRLLSEVENGQWTGVLVMEVERLARGDTIDQGTVAQAFKLSSTKIITPIKTYDPNNEFDEEYFEFGLYMSRRELKTINRRLQRGRIAAVKEGKYLARAPFGYRRVKLEKEKGYTLEIIPEQAKIVQMIFKLYVDDGDRLGIQAVARRLNELRIEPIRHDYWQKETIRAILTNPVYAGKVRWRYRARKKTSADGKVVVSRPINNSGDIIIANGLHQAIINETLFNKAQKYMSENPPAPVGYKKELINPLAGLIICGKCGRSMVWRKRPNNNLQKKDYIVCHARACDNVGAPFIYIETRLLESLKKWADEYRIKWIGVEAKDNDEDGVTLKRKTLAKIETELATLEKQIDAAHNLLEQGIYTIDDFLIRSRLLAERKKLTQVTYINLEKELSTEQSKSNMRKDLLPQIEKLVEIYYRLPTAAAKNTMLKQVLEKSVYIKTVHGAFSGASAADFELTVFPKIPKYI